MALFDFNPTDRWSILLSVIVESGLKNVVLLLIAAAAVACLRKNSAAVRHMVWFVAIVSLSFLPLLSWVLPAWHILPARNQVAPALPSVTTSDPAELLPSFTMAKVASRFPRAHEPESKQVLQVPLVDSAAKSSMVKDPPKVEVAPRTSIPVATYKATQNAAASSLNRNSWVTMVWLAGVFLALLPLGLGIISLRILSNHSRREIAPEWMRLLKALKERLHLHRTIILLKTQKRSMPMTWGIFHSKVLLPDHSYNWPETHRRVVLLHELAHVKRWDYVTNLVTRLVCAVYWFNPLVWLAARLLVIERERACDDMVLQQGVAPADYAQQIIDVVAAFENRRFMPSHGIPMARSSQIEGRLKAILSQQRNRTRVTNKAVTWMLLIFVTILAPVSMMKAAGPVRTTARHPPFAKQSASVVPVVVANQTTASSTFAGNKDFKNPQELYAEIQRILPEGWTAKLRAHDRNGDNLWNLKETPLFRIDLKNPNFSGFGGQYNLQLYFLTNSAENKVFLNLSPDYRYGAIRLFSTSAHYIVFLSRDLINDFPYGLRSVAPVGRALQRYFGSPKDPEIASWIGLEDRPSGVLLGKSGFQGIVLDDETGEPIPRFSLEFNPKPNRVNGPSQAWSMSSQFYGGRFALEGEGYPELERVIRIDEVRELPLWRKGTTVNGWVIAKGYNPEGLTDTSVVWPARLTNIVVRLKRTTVPNDPEVSTSIPKTVDQIFYELQKVLPEGWTCNLVQTTTVPGSESTTEKGSLVRGIYFKNPDISFGGELNLQLYFLTTPEEKRRFFGHWSGKPYGPLLFTDTPDFQVVLFMDVIKGVSTLYPVRSVEPVARILKRYFGPPIDTSLNDSLGLHGIAAGELTGYSGFSGQVLDDETGRPVKKFHLKFVPKARALEDSDLVYFDGRFTLEGNGISGFVVDRKFEWNGYPNWASYNGVQGFVFADGYVSTPLLPEPVPWPAKVTNIVIRLKKKGFPGKMEAPIDETQTAKNEAKSKSSPEPRSILSPIQGRLINETTGETIPQFWLQHGVVTRTGATNWSEYYEARATDWSSTFSIARQSAAQVWRILAISHEPYVVTSQEFDANWGNYVVRLKPGQKLRGRVLNDKGQPVEGTFISVTNVETRLDLVTGLANALGCNSTTTDAQGKFVLPRPSGTKMKIVAISPDRQMIQPASISEDGRDVQITFPQPATLSMNYDIPGDTALPSMGMALVTFEKDPALWKGIEFVVTSPLTNGAKTILSNLTPGRYSFLRGHRTQMPNNSQGVGMGLDAEVLNLEAGKMGAKDIIRTNGFRIRGIVSGLEKAGAEKGRLRVGGGSWGNTTVDALYFGRDGSFQTVMLPPGKYRVEAVALAQAVEPTKSESSGLRETPMSFSAGMVVTLTGTEPEVVKLDLLLSSDPANEKKREEIRREMSSTNGTR